MAQSELIFETNQSKYKNESYADKLFEFKEVF